MNSLAKTMDGKSFLEGMDGRLSGGIIHAARRGRELEMAAEVLDEAGISSAVSRAAAAKLYEIGELNLKERLGDSRPKTWKASVEAILRAKEEDAKQ